jgi:hypothetical protein
MGRSAGRRASNHLVDEAHAGISGSGRLKPVGEVLQRFGKTETDPAQTKHQQESKAPEADRTVQVPGLPVKLT